jgi:hypothetical protein
LLGGVVQQQIMPPHIIIIGMPIAIIFIIISQRSRIASMVVPSIGVILHVTPSLPTSMAM